MSLLLAVLLTAVFFLSRYNRTLKKNNEIISKEIASKMNISERTVEKHKENIFRKLDINTTVELALLFQNKVR